MKVHTLTPPLSLTCSLLLSGGGAPPMAGADGSTPLSRHLYSCLPVYACVVIVWPQGSRCKRRDVEQRLSSPMHMRISARRRCTRSCTARCTSPSPAVGEHAPLRVFFSRGDALATSSLTCRLRGSSGYPPDSLAQYLLNTCSILAHDLGVSTCSVLSPATCRALLLLQALERWPCGTQHGHH